MALLSDKRIKELCSTPIATVVVDGIKKLTSMTREEVDLHNRKISAAMDPYSTSSIAKYNQTVYANYKTVTEAELSSWNPMISDYFPEQVRVENDKKILSYGQSSAGYDVRLDTKFKIFTNINNVIIDPLDFDHNSYVDFEGDVCIIPPNSYILGITKEVFHIPDDILVVCLGKSTYARAGALINTTPVEPGFKGKVVIEISNATSLPLKIYANQGIAQFLFFETSDPCAIPYDSSRKYQGQMEIVTPKV